jgi:hypothetical protein
MVDEKKEVNDYALVQVPTEYGLGIQTPEGKVLTTDQALVEVLNILHILRKEITSK